MLELVDRGWAQLSMSWPPHPQPLVPRFLLSLGLCCFLGGLISGSPSNSLPFIPYLLYLRSMKGLQAFLFSEQSSPPVAGKRRQTREPSCRQGPANKTCFQGCLLGFIFPWVLQWKEQGAHRNEEGHYLLRGPQG